MGLGPPVLGGGRAAAFVAAFVLLFVLLSVIWANMKFYFKRHHLPAVLVAVFRDLAN